MNILIRLSDKSADQMYIHHKTMLDAMNIKHITPSLRDMCQAYCAEYEHQKRVATKFTDFPEITE